MKKVVLKIKKKEFDLIMSGVKKTEWRKVSDYNKKLLLAPSEEYGGKLIGNKEISEIEFECGYGKNTIKHTVKCLSIRPVRFQYDIEIKEDNFKALKGQVAIEIKISSLENEISIINN